jgi:hypothetical protein
VLGDFPVAVTIRTQKHCEEPDCEYCALLGRWERFAVICRDVSTAEFFYGFPNALPTMPCYDTAPEAEQRREDDRTRAWMFALIPRVAVEPTLSLEIIHRLDESALELIVGYLHAVGWIDDQQLQESAARDDVHGRAARRYQQAIGSLADELLPVPSQPSAKYSTRHLPFVRDMAPNVRLAIREVARLAHVRPSLLWQTPISEFLLDFRLLKDEAQRTSALSPEDAAIGFERY